MSAPEYVGWQFRYVFEDQNDRRGSWGCVLIGVRAMPNNYRPHDADRPGRRCRYEVRDVYAGPVGGGPPAAPDLLQMLHECAEYIAALNGEQDDYCQRARALIARATGEEAGGVKGVNRG